MMTESPAERSDGDRALHQHLSNLESTVRRGQRAFLQEVKRDVIVPLREAVEAAAGEASRAAAGDASQTAAGAASQTAAGAASQTASGAASQKASGAASQTASGAASQTAAGAASQTAAGEASQVAAGADSRTIAGREIEAQVIAPLRERLEALDPAGTVDAAWRRLLADQEAMAMELPEVVVRPEPEELYAPAAGDPLSWKLRKASERFRRRRAMLRHRITAAGRRLLRRDPPAPPEYRQEVPLAHLTRHHLRVRLPGIQRKMLGQLQRQMADPLSVLERELTRWTHDVLDERQGEASNGEAQAGDLGAALREAASSLSIESLEAEADLSLAAAAESLARDVRLADSFMLDLAERPAVAGPMPAAASEEALWADWHGQVVERLAMVGHLLRFRSDLAEIEAREVREVLAAAAEPVRAWIEAAAGEMRALAEEAIQAFHATGATPAAALPDLVESLLHRATGEVEERLLVPLSGEGLQQAALTAADAAVSALLERIGELPTELSVHMVAKGGPGADPKAEARAVRLREFATQTFDALLVERLRTAPAPVARVLAQIREEAAGVPAILRYNLEAAVEELQRPAPDGADDRAASARELAVGGLTRSAEVLAGLAALLDEVPPAVTEVVHDAVTRGWARLHERVRLEGRVQEQLLGLRTRLAAQSRQLAEVAMARLERGQARTMYLVRRGRRGAAALVQIGQTAVGTAQHSEQEARRTIDAFERVDALMERFPLVYRRLFSFEPVRDEDLVENRRLDRKVVQSHFERWQQRLAGPLVLTAYYGNGLTSFANSLRRTIFADAAQYELDLQKRVADEADLAALLAEALGLVEKPPGTLDELQAAILDRPAAERPEVCFIEHLELLMLRSAGGTRLLARLMALLARTGHRIVWVCTAADQAWRYFEQVEPVSARLAVSHRLTPMDRPAQELLILNRHQRSGLPVIFDEPEELNPIQRRRLKRVRTERERQALLQDIYFERLFRASGESIRLSLFYWLHSAELREDGVHVRPVRPYSFAFLGALQLSYGFALQAFLQHGSLTLEEHSAIFQTPASSSYEIFEGLINLRIIEDVSGAAGNGLAIRPDGRYRLRPLLAHPVLQYLGAKHIVY